MKPLRIGISANFLYPDLDRPAYPPKQLLFGEEGLYHWIERGGAIPYMIPRLSGTLSLRDVVLDLDGIVFSGGADICPKSYGEEALRPEWQGDFERDQYEIELFHTAREICKPILGICRGHQLINVALGGTLYQDTKTQRPEVEIHRDGVIYDGLTHDVSLIEDSILSKIYDGALSGHINTVHHQAIKDVAKGLKVQALSAPDNVIEAVWGEGLGDGQYVLGVQWHPEWLNGNQFLDPDKIRTHFFDHIQRIHI